MDIRFLEVERQHSKLPIGDINSHNFFVSTEIVERRIFKFSKIVHVTQSVRYRDGYVRWKAEEALSKITGQDFGEDAAKWQERWEKICCECEIITG